MRPRVVDAHCHVDLLQSKRITIGDWAHLLTLDDKEFEFGGAIPNFCYPSVYLKPIGQKKAPRREDNSGAGNNPQLACYRLGKVDWTLGATSGVHPKNALEYNDEVHNFLWKVFEDSSAYGYRHIAIGELGGGESND